MLFRNGQDLPLWRRRVMPWLMAVLRLCIVWVIFSSPLRFVCSPPSFLHLPMGLRTTFIVLLLLGAPLFLWSRSCWIGGLGLVAAIAAYERLWLDAGLPAGGMPVLAVGLIVVLCVGEWGGRLAQSRLYRSPD
jgi:hypothetical protein